MFCRPLRQLVLALHLGLFVIFTLLTTWAKGRRLMVERMREGAMPIKVFILNNEYMGMVRQWQSLFYDKRYSNTDLHTSIGSRIPDFVMMAEAYGCLGLRCERPEDVDDVIRQALECNDRPVVIDFVVERDAMVWPMVPAGVSNDLITMARDITPVWDRDDDDADDNSVTTFNVHQLYLTAHSVVFEAMLLRNGNTREAQERRVVIRDLSAKTVHSLLLFIYTGALAAEEDFTLELLSAADKVCPALFG